MYDITKISKASKASEASQASEASIIFEVRYDIFN